MNARIALIIAALIVSAACSAPDRKAASAADGAAADLAIVNGKVHTSDEANHVAQAVAITGTTILKVGTNDEINSVTGPKTRVIDAHGATVAPGFNDSHVHFLSGGRSLSDVDLAGLTTLPQVQEKIRAFAAGKPADAWIKGRGWLYTPFANGSPTRQQLDAVVPDRPAVMTCYDGHSVWVNSKVLELAGITSAAKDPVNGLIVRDDKGEPTGHLKESAADLISRVLPNRTHRGGVGRRHPALRPARRDCVAAADPRRARRRQPGGAERSVARCDRTGARGAGVAPPQVKRGGLMSVTIAPLSTDEIAAIEDVQQRFVAGLLARDFDALVGLYTEDAVFMPPNQPAVRGRAALKTWMAAFPQVTACTLNTERIDGRADLAYVRGSFEMTLRPEGAPEAVTSHGKFVEIRRRQPNGEWLLEADIFNSDHP